MSKHPIQLSDHFTYPRLLKFVAPSILMMIFTSIYYVVDGFFVSNYVGKTPFAALNFIMPFIMILGGMGFIVGTGGSALVAKELGRGQKEMANRIFSLLIAFVIITGIALSVLGIVFIRPIAQLMGASETMLEDCVLYGRVIIAFTTAYMLQNVFQSFLIVAERPRIGLAIVIAAGVTNMVLDALFIAVFHWGLAGAALASGIGQCLGGFIPLLCRRNGLSRQPKQQPSCWTSCTGVVGRDDGAHCISAGSQAHGSVVHLWRDRGQQFGPKGHRQGQPPPGQTYSLHPIGARLRRRQFDGSPATGL